jgi:hypothetical protein
MQGTKYQRLRRSVAFLAAFAAIFYGAYSGHEDFMHQFAVAGAQMACQQHSEVRSPNRQIDCSPENAVALESAVFNHRLAEAHNPLTLALIAVGCLVVVGVANLLIG